MSRARILAAAGIALALLAFFVAGGHRYLTLEWLQAQRDLLEARRAAHPGIAALAFFAVYVVVTGLSLPGAALLTLVGGALFGLVWGTVLVSFASSLGASAAFLLSRYLLRDWVEARFGRHLVGIHRGMEREGSFYLFTLRLIPAIPFFAINLAMGLTRLRVRTFYWVSQLGMLPGTLVYVNAGKQLGTIDTLGGILSWRVVIAFVLLGVFPLAAKRLLELYKARRRYARWARPKRFDRNLIVIGGGSAGLVAAYIGATLRARVTLVEKDRMGGDCLNTGCVPSKALIQSARVLHQMRSAERYGIRIASAEADFPAVMERVRRVVREVEPHDSAERYSALGVECLHGEAKITSPWTVSVNGRELTTRAIIIAAGARPIVPDIPGIGSVEVLTSENVWNLRHLPRRLAVLGGGPIGVELAQAFARLGSGVTLVEALPRLLAREDTDVSELLRRQFLEEGIHVLTAHRAVRVERDKLVCAHETGETAVEFDALLCAIGRSPRTEGYGLEELGIPLGPSGVVETNEYLQTAFPNIYACGDAAGPYQFTHVAAHQAWHAAVNALFGAARKFRVDYSVIPWTTFTDPEIARVGLSEADAKAGNVAHEVTVFPLRELDRAIADGKPSGFVKVLTAPRSDRILGATIAGERAGDLIAQFVSAMKHGIGLKKILGTIHVYPTFAEAGKQAAGAWRRAHAPAALLRRVERFHAWMRG